VALGHLILLVSGPNGLVLIHVVATLLESIPEVLHCTKHMLTGFISFTDVEPEMCEMSIMLLTDTSDCLRCYQCQAP